MANTKLDVRGLRISFRTVSGKVQAVRGISFDLKEGETLAIVGESGSGKSVTSKAILGILAGNSIIEGGEILYDGKDLLKIPEDEFYKIRGDKIAMIFQDPLSSLNPIMRVGKQLTEAMLLKGKARQRASRAEFNKSLKLLNKTMLESSGTEEAARDAINTGCKNFDKFEFKHIALEKEYNEAFHAAENIVPEIENVLFLIEKNAFTDARHRLNEIVTIAGKAFHTYVVDGADAGLLRKALEEIRRLKGTAIRKKEYGELLEPLTSARNVLQKAISLPKPDFFAMGYYLTFEGETLPAEPVLTMNKTLEETMDRDFMNGFMGYTGAALRYSAEEHYALKESVLKDLEQALISLEGAPSQHRVSDLRSLEKELNEKILASIDPMEIVKDSTAYTFGSSMKDAIAAFDRGNRKNGSEQKRYEKEQRQFDKYVARTGREPDWKPTPAALVDLDLTLENMRTIIRRVQEDYQNSLEKRSERDYDKEAATYVEHLKTNASGAVNHVTRHMARAKALKLIEEVGINEPRRRYRQYPFEFSGGMRQRIVIAIALAADPDILICDEPTTALDVTIQAQILELINKLKQSRNLSIIFITHDLGVVANMADKIAVMYAGKIVEYGSSADVFYDPRHPYTWALLSSMPDLDTKEKLESIPGTPPNMIYPPKGDAFAARNKYALEIDFEEQPPMFQISDTHFAATWLLHPDAPKMEPPRIVTERIAKMRKANGESHE